MEELDNNELADDALYTPQFENHIREFCRVTNSAFTLATISPIIEVMKESQIIRYVISDPSHQGGISCLRNYVLSRRHIPRNFVGRFLAVISVKVNVMPGHLGIANQSYVAKVIMENVKPPVLVTNFTVQSMLDQLRTDIKRGYDVQAHLPVPTKIKVRLNQNTLSQLINAMSDLCKTITEGNRQQGREVEPYIRNKIKYT